MKRTTIHDVAELAGVSYQTVSRVLNHKPDVASETRQRVNHAILTLGYQPSAVAQSLARKRTNTLGLITIDFEDYFFAGVCSGVQEEAHRHGYMLMITSTSRDFKLENTYLSQLKKHRADGIIAIRDTILNPGTEILSSEKISEHPFVAVCMKFPGEEFPLIDVDNFEGARQVAQHFINFGHRKFAMVTSPLQYKVTKDRTEGFLSILKKEGIEFDPNLCVPGDWHFSGGYSATKELLKRSREFTALFIHNDDMAIGAMRAISEEGLRVPGDISIVGFDDIPVADHLVPRLTTVWQPRHEIGHLAVQLVLEQIAGKQVRTNQTILLKPRLVQRESVSFIRS